MRALWQTESFFLKKAAKGDGSAGTPEFVKVNLVGKPRSKLIFG